MTDDSYLFKTQPGPGRVPLYEGKMIWQFDANYAEPKYWVDSQQSIAVLKATGVMNGFVIDWLLRQKITSHLNMFYVYQVPVPRDTSQDLASRIVARTASLVCTTPEFDDLANSVGRSSGAQGAIDPAKRAQLRAELDGLVAHLYGLTEAEFVHILGTFPLVPQPTKVAAQNAYRDVERGLIR